MAAHTEDRRSDDLESRFGNRFVIEDVPDHRLPESGMPAVDAMRLIGEELVLDGEPHRNLATFVTTWMEPEAQRVIAESLHRNFIDHAEYPRTAEIEQRCIRMLGDRSSGLGCAGAGASRVRSARVGSRRPSRRGDPRGPAGRPRAD